MATEARSESYAAAATAAPNDAVASPPASPSAMADHSRITQARAAHAAGDVEASRVVHEKPIEQHAGATGEYIKAIVFGGVDGIITTFAVVAAVVGADLSTKVLLILGFSNLLADGVSMGFGEYLSGDAENKHIEQERQRESWELDNHPEGEIEEMIALYEEKGIATDDAELILKTMAKYREFFVDHMMVQELGMMLPDEDDPTPLKQGAAMFCAFLLFGCVPLLAYVCFETVTGKDELFAIACCLTAVALFGLGAFSSKFNSNKWYQSGFWVLANGCTAAAVSYGVGAAVAEIVGADPDSA